MSKYNFDNKRVWVCGASSGIGEALVYEFNKKGAKLIISSRRVEKLEKVKENCDHPENVEVIPVDITKQDMIDSAVTKVQQKGKLDLLILDSGIAQKGLVKDNSEVVERRIMETNYFGTVALAKAVLPIFLEQKYGWFGVVTSIAGVIGVPGRSVYSASKHALHGYFDSLRAELHGQNIQVSLIMPGFVNTHITVKELKSDGSSYGKVEKSHALGMSPEVCAEHIIHGLERQKLSIIVGGFETTSVYLSRFSPWLYDFMVCHHPMKKWRKIVSAVSFNTIKQ